MKKIGKRRQARMVAVQILYQFINAPEYFSLDQAKRYALEAGLFPDPGFESLAAEDYLDSLIEGVCDHLAEIDESIESFLQDWTLERIANIDLTILRLAFYEIYFVEAEEVPPIVAVNEAIDLSKIFSDDQSRIFINGVLAKVLEEVK